MKNFFALYRKGREIEKYLNRINGPVSSVVKHNPIGAGGLGFDFQAGQIGHSVDNGSPPL